MSGQGAYGVRGPTGPTGINGRKGRQGDGFGYTGYNLFTPGGILTTSVLSGTSPYALTVTPGVSGTYYQFNLTPETVVGTITDNGTLVVSSGATLAVGAEIDGPGIYPGTTVDYLGGVADTYYLTPRFSTNSVATTFTVVPSITLTLPTSGLTAGMFWVFNSITGVTNVTFKINLVNGTAVYNGESAATVVRCAVGNSLLLAYSGTAGSYIVF